jgi:hypothetical protein
LLLQNLHIETQTLTNPQDELHDKALFIPTLIEAIDHYAKFNNGQRWQLMQYNDKAIAKRLLKASK